MNQRVQQRLLKMMNIECEIASNGVEGVEKFKELMEKGERYPLILMDFHMPEMDGKEATRLIREMERERNVKPTHIVGLTADPEGESEGMCTVIAKPIRKQSFSEIVD